VRTSAASIERVTVSSCDLVFASTSPNLPNSVFTAPSTCHTSLERFSMASVRKPICKLLSKAVNVVGPAIVTR
jgi:hypothetical protein